YGSHLGCLTVNLPYAVQRLRSFGDTILNSSRLRYERERDRSNLPTCSSCMDGPRWARSFCIVGTRSGAVMYPACLRGRMTAGPDGFRGLGSQHCGALAWRDDVSECPNPGPDHFAVAAFCSLRVAGRRAPARNGCASSLDAAPWVSR